MEKIFVFGDIHGQLGKLENLVAKLNLTVDDTLIFLGDYVDRGPDSCGVIELLLKLNKSHKCFFIKGNHDHVFFYDVLHNGNHLNKSNLGYWSDGAKETFKSYRKAKINPDDHLESFYRLLLPYYVNHKRLFVHAGFNPSYPINDQPDKSIYWWDRTLITEAVKMHSKSSLTISESFNEFDTIYIGHTPVQNWGYTIPCKWTNIWNLDTGAGRSPSEKLSCLEVFSETIYQSDF